VIYIKGKHRFPEVEVSFKRERGQTSPVENVHLYNSTKNSLADNRGLFQKDADSPLQVRRERNSGGDDFPGGGRHPVGKELRR